VSSALVASVAARYRGGTPRGGAAGHGWAVQRRSGAGGRDDMTNDPGYPARCRVN